MDREDKKSQDFIREITKLKKQLRASDQRFFNVTGKNLEGIVVVCSATIVYVNPAAEKVFGRNIGELLGEDFGLPLEVGHLSDFRIFNPNSGEVFVEILVNLIEWEDEAAYLLIFRDITERKKTESLLRHQKQALERTNKELDTFAYTVSHDIRGPVRSMRAFASFIKEDCHEILDDQSKNHLDRIIKAGEKVHTMMDDILEFSRIGRIEKEKQTVNIKEIVEEVLVLLSKDINDLSAVIQLEDQFPTWRCHRNRIAQVILNFVTNSLKYVAQGIKPEIVIGMVKRKGRQWVYIKDNGIGIKEEFFGKVFEVFRRLHSGNKLYEGTGIGLGTVKKIIDTHGGEILIESKEGLGSTFFFTLETKGNERSSQEKKKIGKILLEEKVISEKQLKAALAKQLGTDVKMELAYVFNNHLLVVDDSIDDINIFKVELKKYDPAWTVSYASSGEGALDYMIGRKEFADRTKHLEADVVLLDINLLGMSGFDVLNKLREDPRFKYIPIITMYTSSNTLNDKEKALMTGADKLITKTSDHTEVFKAIEEMMVRAKKMVQD